MIIAVVPFIIALVGLLVWLLTVKPAEAGRICFACGVFVTTVVLSHAVLRVGSLALAIVPVVLAVVGLILWFAAQNPKVQEIGRIFYACGLLVFTLVVARETVRIGSAPSSDLVIETR